MSEREGFANCDSSWAKLRVRQPRIKQFVLDKPGLLLTFATLLEMQVADPEDIQTIANKTSSQRAAPIHNRCDNLQWLEGLRD